MDAFISSCDLFSDYPENLIKGDALSHNLQAYRIRLRNESGRLFNNREHSTVGFLEIRRGDAGYDLTSIRCLTSLKEHLREALISEREDPMCRYVFLNAPHSRDALRVTFDMLKFLFTYHQVTPTFLDFLFPFGKQIYAQDLHFSGLRDDSQFISQQECTRISKLGRSASMLRCCYNLRSAEESRDQSGLPWSIRQTAVYQTFDMPTGQAVWIFIKGNKVIEERIKEASKSATWVSADSPSGTFATALRTHLIICDWSGENWRWYINKLEDEMQQRTRGALAMNIDKAPSRPSSPGCGTYPGSPMSRTSTMSPLSRGATWSFTKSSRSDAIPISVQTSLSAWSPATASQSPVFVARTRPSGEAINHSNDRHNVEVSELSKISNIRTRLVVLLHDIRKREAKRLRSCLGSQNISPADTDIEKNATHPATKIKLIAPEQPPTSLDELVDKSQTGFTFSDLQNIQFIEEKAQEALLVLKLNTEVFEELREHYKNAVAHKEFPEQIMIDCKDDLLQFDRRVVGVKKDMRMLLSRTENLLQLLSNRKNLINEILQYRSVTASESLAKKAQSSADHMEYMTKAMYDIAHKTKQETVSMRVITSVTLFFLPATFIATFMSTDIIKYDKGVRVFEIDGFKLYLCIALPLTALTFVAWLIIYRIAKTSDFPFAQKSQVVDQTQNT